MEELKTLYIDSEDFSDILGNIQDSFNFEFLDGEIENLITIEQLSNKVISRLDFQEGNECTSQIVFYKLRKHLIERLKMTDTELRPKTRLRELFPRNGRKQLWSDVFSDFYVKIPSLTPPTYLIITLILAFLVSIIILLSYSYIFGLILISILWICWKLSYRFGKSFPVENLGNLVKKTSSENYIDSRKHIKTINIPEIKRLIYDMIVDWQSDSDKELVTMNTKLDYIGGKSTQHTSNYK